MNTLVPTARAGGGSALIAIEYQMDTPVYARIELITIKGMRIQRSEPIATHTTNV